jgi:hypothetical protein
MVYFPACPFAVAVAQAVEQAVTKSFEYRGDLRVTTLPEMLFTIHRFQVPGVIEARRNGVEKRVYVKQDAVFHATSSDLADSLGSYLRRVGKLNPAQYEAAMRARSASEQRLGVLLVEKGFLDPAAVYEALRQHVEEIVWSLFYWQDGEVCFQIGDAPAAGPISVMVPLRQVILSGIKRAPNPKELVARLGRKETVFEPCHHIEDLIESGLNAEEYALLRLVDGRHSLFDVCTRGPLAPGDNAKLMYAFYVLQLIRRAEGTSTPKPPEKDSGKIKIRFRTERDHGES